ncbi:DUF5339 family protein [Uliginosibacterium sp. sgz301328]|uniref:DUF5339 family protein n=1 Tax=Uliginosibacterium sp. sgz301328 TaxID=3243764 RepID=UPI00359CBB03
MSKKFSLLIAMLAAAAMLGACTKKEEAAPASAPAAAASSAAAAESSVAAATEALPAECEDYIKQVNACVEKIGGGNAAVASTIKQQMDQTRASWAQISDKAALGAACKQSADAFAASGKAMGC